MIPSPFLETCLPSFVPISVRIRRTLRRSATQPQTRDAGGLCGRDGHKGSVRCNLMLAGSPAGVRVRGECYSKTCRLEMYLELVPFQINAKIRCKTVNPVSRLWLKKCGIKYRQKERTWKEESANRTSPLALRGKRKICNERRKRSALVEPSAVQA